MKYWYILIGTYLVLHIGVMTSYTSLPGYSPEWQRWLYASQWLVPTSMFVLLVPRIQQLLNRIATLPMWTVMGPVVVVACIVLYFTNVLGRGFAWSTLGLLVLLVLLVASTQTRPRNVAAWLLGAMVAFLAMGSWECLYQTGLLIYHDFFGCGMMNYYVSMTLQLTWILPALIVILVLYQRGLRPYITRITLICTGISIAATVIWFANGFDIPLLFWKGKFVEVNEAARPWLISVSRASQSFWLLGIASAFTRRNESV